MRTTVISAWQINLSWAEPENKNGEIWRYEIDVREVASTTNVGKSSTENTSFEAKDLKPYTRYAFKITAIGSGGNSGPVIVEAVTFTSSKRFSSVLFLSDCSLIMLS